MALEVGAGLGCSLVQPLAIDAPSAKSIAVVPRLTPPPPRR